MLIAQAAAARPAVGLDARFVGLAHQIPGFGGYFFDDNGDLIVYLRDMSQASAACALLRPVAENRTQRWNNPWARPADIIFRPAAFDFIQLDNWRGALEPLLVPEGKHLIDTDEGANRIWIGVTSRLAQQRVLSHVSQLAIPASAVAVDVIAPPAPLSTLQDYTPMVGGLAIDFSNGSHCTLGLNVWYTNLAQGIGVGTPGFYTASHCSTTWGGSDTTAYFHNNVRIGQERYDPGYFTNAYNTACPINVQCRWSDVSFATYDSTVAPHQGYLAQTLYTAFGEGAPSRTVQDMSVSGSTDINSSQPEWTFSNGVQPVQGTAIAKMGRYTGWTSGTVINTCVNDQEADNRYFLCQDAVNAYAFPGDSGAPAFQQLSGTNAAYAGTVWAQYTDPRPGKIGFLFSNVDNIAKDMGYGVTYGPN